FRGCVSRSSNRWCGCHFCASVGATLGRLEERVRSLAVAGAFVLSVASPSAQERTLREQFDANPDSTITLTMCGPIWHLESAISETDVIVRGTLASPRAHFTPDDKSIVTSYELSNPKILYTRKGFTPAKSISVAILGGSVELPSGYHARFVAEPVP